MNTTTNKLDLGTNAIGYAIVNESKNTKYTKYKDSGIDWLGEIPSHWEMIPNRYLFQLKKIQVGKRSVEYDLLSLTLRGIIKRDMENPEGKFPAEFDTYQEVKINDFVFCLFDVEETPRTVGLSSFDGMITGAYTVMKPSENSVSKYLYYYYLSIDDRKQLKYLYRGLRNTIPKENFFGLNTALPPIPEQKVIAAFLDEKCAQLDALVSVKEQQIALLKERRQVVIHEAVTKGIPNTRSLSGAETKHSGIDWIGEIPSDWEVKRLKFTSKLINDKSISKHSELPYYGMENIESWSGNYIKTDSEVDGLGNLFYEGNVLFGKLRPYLAKVHLAVESGICSSEFLVYDSKLLNNKYLKTMMISPEFIKLVNASTYGAKMPRANSEFINNQEVPIPPVTEQEAIVTYLEEQTGKIDQAIAIKTEQITKLKEYKQSLINEVVTGKVKVC